MRAVTITRIERQGDQVLVAGVVEGVSGEVQSVVWDPHTWEGSELDRLARAEQLLARENPPPPTEDEIRGYGDGPFR